VDNTKFSVEVEKSAEDIWDSVIVRGSLLDKWDNVRWCDLPAFERRQMCSLVSEVRSASDLLARDIERMSKADRISFYKPFHGRKWFALFPLRSDGYLVWLRWVWKVPGGYTEMLS